MAPWRGALRTPGARAVPRRGRLPGIAAEAVALLLLSLRMADCYHSTPPGVSLGAGRRPPLLLQLRKDRLSARIARASRLPPRMGTLTLSLTLLAPASAAQEESPNPLLFEVAAARVVAETRLEEKAPHEWMIYRATADVVQMAQSALSLTAPSEWGQFSAAILAGGPNASPEHIDDYVRKETALSQAAPRAYSAYELALDAHAKAQELLEKTAPSEWVALEAITLSERAGKMIDRIARNRDRP